MKFVVYKDGPDFLKSPVGLDCNEMETIHNALQVYMEYLDQKVAGISDSPHEIEGAEIVLNVAEVSREMILGTRTDAYDVRQKLVGLVGDDLTESGC